MKKRNIVLISVFIGCILLDQLTKYFIDNQMQLYDSFTIIKGFFSITYTHNTGAAFSILEGKLVFFYLVTIVAVILLTMYFRTLKDYQFLSKLGIVMMLSGTLGNLIDRFLFHYVRDFLDFIIFGYDFAIFNVADACLCIGIVLVLIDEFMNDFGVKKHGKNI